nr:peptidase c14 caspase catalytic subunit p20 [Colletotrichum truncatum]KAF6797474.1 peptidase c14 caspase catalytic subunit p20 [Colletotrichum truncatum]
MDDVKIMASVLTSSFTGTLDVELTYLLGAITDRGRKVTAIFDCCHSGRMARDPSDDESMPRNLPKHAVRIGAATSTEIAWEHSRSGQWAGILTQTLAKVLQETWINGGDNNSVSWRTILLVCRKWSTSTYPYRIQMQRAQIHAYSSHSRKR